MTGVKWRKGLEFLREEQIFGGEGSREFYQLEFGQSVGVNLEISFYVFYLN